MHSPIMKPRETHKPEAFLDLNVNLEETVWINAGVKNVGILISAGGVKH